MKCLVAVAALVLLGFAASANAQKVTKVPRADTLVVYGVGTVRLAGIAASDDRAFRLGLPGPTPQPRSGPSSPPPALIGGRVNLTPDRSSRDFLKKLALGKDVSVEFDDPGGRADPPRAYVSLQDGTLVNAEMLRQGRATVDTSAPFARLDEFKRLEKEAQDAGRGIWAATSVR